MNSIFKRPFLCKRSHSAGPRELSIPILLDEEISLAPGGSVGKRSGSARNRLDGTVILSSAPPPPCLIKSARNWIAQKLLDTADGNRGTSGIYSSTLRDSKGSKFAPENGRRYSAKSGLCQREPHCGRSLYLSSASKVRGHCSLGSCDYTSVCSASSNASSTSIPRYRTVLSSLVCPSNICTALMFLVRR
jgi:hypothetical protein